MPDSGEGLAGHGEDGPRRWPTRWAAVNARLDRVVYGARDPKAGCAGSVADLFVMPFNHTPVIRSGILEEECAQLLSDFFAGLRSFSPDLPGI